MIIKHSQGKIDSIYVDNEWKDVKKKKKEEKKEEKKDEKDM